MAHPSTGEDNMARRKTNVGQQQFGFPDEDLKTSLHDEIVIWLKKNALDISRRLLGWRGSWDAAWIEGMRSRFAGAVEQRRKDLRRDLKAGVLWRHTNDRGDQAWQEERGKPARLRLMEEHLSLLESWEGLGKPPPPRIEVTSALEVPITRESTRLSTSSDTRTLCFPFPPVTSALRLSRRPIRKTHGWNREAQLV